MSLSILPNIITVFRLMLIIPFLHYLANEHYKPAFYIFFIAGFSDGLDGFLARRYNWISEFGSFLDPLADKLLVMTAFFALAYIGKVPYWLCLLVIGRDIVIMAGTAFMMSVLEYVEFKPSMLSKINTALQVLVISSLLFELAFSLLPDSFVQFIIATMVCTTIASMLHYVYVNSCYVYRKLYS